MVYFCAGCDPGRRDAAVQWLPGLPHPRRRRRACRDAGLTGAGKPGKTRKESHPTGNYGNKNTVNKALLLPADDFNRTLRRFAHQFIEPYDDPSGLAIIGMQTRGVYLAKRIQQHILNDFGVDVPLGVLDVTFYRDDFRTRMKMPEVKVTEIPFDLFEKDVVLVDDVLYTGRTVRSAMEALMSFGRPRSIRFCCMVDRGHRELPVYADYIGAIIPTHKSEEVRVFLQDPDGEDAVYLLRPEPGESLPPKA